MGSVYLAEQISTGKARAVKLMHPALVSDDELRRRFEQEARIGARIASDHVVEVQAAGVDAASGAPFIVMERLEGETLHERLARTGLLPFHELRPIFEQLCHAVAAAHAAGIVHRDLKPENVFLAQTRRASGPSLSVKVLDFGIAKLVAEVGARGTTAAMGSPLWMAPEQTEPGSITPAADVWSLGLIAFYALTGNHFWRAARDSGATVSQLFRELVLDDIPPASVRADERASRALLPEGFDAWFGRCVCRAPAERYAHGGACWQGMRALFGDLAPGSGEEAFAATALGTPASNPGSASGGLRAPATAPGTGPAAPYALYAPPPQAGAFGPMTGATPPPVASTTPPTRAASVGPWILGSASVLALAVFGSAYALLRSRDGVTDTLDGQVSRSGVAIQYTATRTPAPVPTDTAAHVEPAATEAIDAGLAPKLQARAPAPPVVAARPPPPAAAAPVSTGASGAGRVYSRKVAGRTVTVQSGAIRTTGNVAVEVIRSAMDHAGWEYLVCYETAFKNADSFPEGTVKLRFKIFDQLPREARVDASDIAAPAFTECVRGTALGQTANAAGPSGFATVDYTLHFALEK